MSNEAALSEIVKAIKAKMAWQNQLLKEAMEQLAASNDMLNKTKEEVKDEVRKYPPHTPTPLPNALEQAAHAYAHDWVWPVKGVLWGVQETQQNNAMYELLKETFTAGHQHALSTLPDLIKKVLERAAKNAKIIDFASNYIDHGKTGAQIFEVDKQSILDTKFDDLLK